MIGSDGGAPPRDLGLGSGTEAIEPSGAAAAEIMAFEFTDLRGAVVGAPLPVTQ